MGSLIDEEMPAAFAVVGSVDTVGRLLPIFPTASASSITPALKEFRL